MGELMSRRLHEMASRHPFIGAIRGLGALWGVVLDARWTQSGFAEDVMYQALARGLNFKVSSGTVLTLSPALVTPDDEIDRAMDILVDAISVEAKEPSAESTAMANSIDMELDKR